MSPFYLAAAYCLFAVTLQQLSPEQRAVNYLSKEVPAWSRDNHCFSCHNNGDAARALYVASRMKLDVPPSALKDTTEWITRPKAWDDIQGAGFSDKRLARIQFASALVEATDAGFVVDRAPLADVAEPLVASQEANGGWTVDANAIVGLPATYGPFLATAQARSVLQRAPDQAKYAGSITAAADYLIQAKPTSVINAGGIVLGLVDNRTTAGYQSMKAALEFILKAQAKDGGWGPFPNTPTEVFDSSVAVLAMVSVRGQFDISSQLARGRAYLLANQLLDGDWPATTRPSGGQSYAEHISTAGWATLALLRTMP